MINHIKMERAAATQVGFTLIEAMIVMVIVAALLLVALPGYQNSMNKTRRAEAMRDLMELASRQERFYAQNSRYTDVIWSGEDDKGLNLERELGVDGFYLSGNLHDKPYPNPHEHHYNLEIIKYPGKEFTTCYINRAFPYSKSPQIKDTECAVLTVDCMGERKATNDKGENNENCW